MKRIESELTGIFESKFSFLFEQFKKLPNYGQSNPTFVTIPKASGAFGKIKVELLDFNGEAEVEAYGGVHVISFTDKSRISIIYANDQENFDWLYGYNSYFTSIILGKIFKSAGIKYSHEGLQYIQHDLRENHKAEIGFINITKDFSKVLDILDFNKEEFYKGFSNFNELFEFIVKSPYFNAVKFTNPEKEYKSITLQRLEEYLILNNLADKKGEQLTYERVKSFFPHIEFDKLAVALLEKAQKKMEIIDKLNGRVILDTIPGFEPKLIGISMSKFKFSFGSKDAYLDFMTNNSQEAVISKFKEVNQVV